MIWLSLSLSVNILSPLTKWNDHETQHVPPGPASQFLSPSYQANGSPSQNPNPSPQILDLTRPMALGWVLLCYCVSLVMKLTSHWRPAGEPVRLWSHTELEFSGPQGSPGLSVWFELLIRRLFFFIRNLFFFSLSTQYFSGSPATYSTPAQPSQEASQTAPPPPAPSKAVLTVLTFTLPPLTSPHLTSPHDISIFISWKTADKLTLTTKGADRACWFLQQSNSKLRPSPRIRADRCGGRRVPPGGSQSTGWQSGQIQGC